MSPSMKTKDINYEVLLRHYSIRPSTQRILILKAILSQTTPAFNYSQIIDIVRKERGNPALPPTGVRAILLLFKLKGLIIKLDDVEPVFKKGRPKFKFKISEDALLKIKLLLEQQSES